MEIAIKSKAKVPEEQAEIIASAVNAFIEISFGVKVHVLLKKTDA